MEREFKFFIQRSAPNILKSKIKALDISSFQELLNTDIEIFLKVKGFGRKCIIALDELKKEIASKNLNLPFSFNPTLALKEMESFVSDFFDAFQDPKLKIIFEKRIIKESITLEELGIYFGLTRERIRQIENDLRNKLFSILTDNYFGRVKLVPHKNLCFLLNKTSEYLEKEGFTNQDTLIEHLEISYQIDLNKQIDTFLLLLNLIGVARLKIDDEIYIISKYFNSKYDLSLIYRTITEVLTESVTPISILDVVIQCKKRIKNRNFPNDYIQKLLSLASAFNIDGSFAHITSAKLSTYGDIAYRVLYENGSPMHFKEIFKEVNFRRVKANKKIFIERNSAPLLGQDNKFISEGRSGYWGLSTWGEGKTVKDRIIEYVLKENKPVSKEEIYLNIQLPDQYKENALSQILHMCIGNELEYDKDRKIILTSWTHLYGKSEKKKLSYDRDEFLNKLREILKRQALTARAIYDSDLSFKKIKNGTFTQRLNKMTELEKTIQGNKKLYKWRGKRKTALKTKFQQTEELAIEFIKMNGGKVSLTSLKKHINKFQIKDALVYKVISESQNFCKEKDEQYKTRQFVSLNTENTEGTLEQKPSSEEEILLKNLLNKEESKTLEFKSTLRFDKKVKKINHELEWSVLKTTAGFLNSAGGTLLIGVSDNKDVLGLDSDIATMSKKPNVDGFVLHLGNILNSHFKPSTISENVKIKIIQAFGKTVCMIETSKSNEPIMITPKRGDIKEKGECFYIRSNNSTIRLKEPSTM